MLQRYLVTLNVSHEFLGENARRSFRAAARRWGAQYLEILTPAHPGQPLLDKLCLPDFLPQTGRFAFLDADTLIRADCPSLFDIVPEGHFGGVLSHQPGHELADRHVLASLPQWLERHGIRGLNPIDDYLNTGVLVFDRPTHDAVFRKAMGSGWEHGDWVITDQAMLSAAIHLLGVPLFRLAPQFNRCGDAIWQRWTPGMRDFVWHFCGFPDLKWRIDHTNWYDLGPNREADGVVRWSNGRPATSHGGEGLPLLLRELCRLRPEARVVEIGAGLGGLTSYILPFLRDLGGTLRSVDCWADSPEVAGSPDPAQRAPRPRPRAHHPHRRRAAGPPHRHARRARRPNPAERLAQRATGRARRVRAGPVPGRPRRPRGDRARPRRRAQARPRRSARRRAAPGCATRCSRTAASWGSPPPRPGATLAAMPDALPITRPIKPRVALFVTCLVDFHRPTVGFAAIKLLEQAGCQVAVPRAQTCCGQPAYNSGDRRTTADLARGVLDAFGGYDYVVVPSGSCAGMLRHHMPHLFDDDPNLRARADALAARTFELVSFLADVMGVADLPARWTGGPITYHDSCAGLRELGIKKQPRALLGAVGAEIVEMADPEVCCGFGGTFCVKYPEISVRMVSDKTADIASTGAATLLSGDMGCLLNMAGRLEREGKPVAVRHVAEVLAGMTTGVPPIGRAR